MLNLLETAEIVLEHRSIAKLHECPNCRRRRIELCDLILVNNTPVAIVARKEGGSLKLQLV